MISIISICCDVLLVNFLFLLLLPSLQSSSEHGPLGNREPREDEVVGNVSFDMLISGFPECKAGQSSDKQLQLTVFACSLSLGRVHRINPAHMLMLT